MSREFLLQVFFHESSSPKPLKITEGLFQIFSKIRGDIRKSKSGIGINNIAVSVANMLPLSLIPVANLLPDVGWRLTPVANFTLMSIKAKKVTISLGQAN
jgi:hypothetical protein